ncbi:MAG: hypothetical protein GY803_23705 [Chloroflexi bacterium]|nr:hypothetical protein [Chloroflexota bacterium]
MKRKEFPELNSGRHLWLGLLLIPVSFVLVWGDYFDDGAYTAYRFAQNLALGRGLAHDAGIVLQAAPVSPLYIFVMALLEPIMPQAGALLSALGWGSAAIIGFRAGLEEKRPLSAIPTAILIAFIPLIPHTLGGPIPWAIALGWTAVRLAPPLGQAPTTARARHAWQASLLLPVVYFDASTMLLAVWLLGRQWRDRSGQLRAALAVWLTAVLGWLWFVSKNWGLGWMIRPFSQGDDLAHLLRSSELYWLFLPFALLGGWAIWKNRQDAERTKSILLWLTLVWLSGSQLTGAVTAVAVLLLTGLGAEWLVKQAIRRQTIPIRPISLALILTAPLLLIQLISLWQQYAARPTAQFALEAQLADWLRTNSAPEAILYAAPHIGYRAQRATIPAVLDADPLLDLIAAEPDFIISADNIAWKKITETDWFRARYTSSQQFAADYAPFSPVIAWKYAPSPFDFGELIPINAVIPGRLKMVGYKYEPTVIAPGDSIYLTVYLQAIQPIAVGFQTQVDLTYALDEWVWAWKRQLTPRSVPGHRWTPGQIIPERFELETKETIPYGAYKLQILWNGADGGPLWPIYRDNDEHVLDRILLDYIAVPPPVDDGGATAVNARFGDQITLSGYEALGEAAPGQPVEIALYWQAVRPPDDNYFVFIHLFDAAGQLVANHDEQPMNGRFVTRAWQPGITIQDSHPLPLPHDLSPGRYQVMVGLYLQETGVRLPVWDAAGEEQANGSLPLTSIEIK